MFFLTFIFDYIEYIKNKFEKVNYKYALNEILKSIHLKINHEKNKYIYLYFFFNLTDFCHRN